MMQCCGLSVQNTVTIVCVSMLLLLTEGGNLTSGTTCADDEVLKNCGKECEKTCATVMQSHRWGTCWRRRGCIGKERNCGCKPGLVRQSDGTCDTIDKCPKELVNKTCGTNEELSLCWNRCTAYCETLDSIIPAPDLNSPICRKCTEDDSARCVCNPGYYTSDVFFEACLTEAECRSINATQLYLETRAKGQIP